MAEKPDIDPFLAGLDAKIFALQQFRESYLTARAAGLLGPGVDVSTLTQSTAGSPTAPQPQPAQNGAIELPTGVFRGKGLADAIRLFLSIAKRKQTAKEIKTALMDGGLATTSVFFDQTLAGTLHRLRKGGELVQFKDGWDLAESYPESFRQRMTDGKEPSVKATAKRKRRKKKAATATKPAKPATAARPKPVKATNSKAATAEPTAADAPKPLLRAV